jgi:cytidine deaminase
MDQLLESASNARKNAYAPYSNYKVGVALEDERGEVHLGANVENVSYGATICAERAAVTRMISEGGRQVRRLALVTKDGGTPCGICLQVLAEFCTPETPILIANEQGEIRTLLFRDLAPDPFRSDTLSPPKAL